MAMIRVASKPLCASDQTQTTAVQLAQRWHGTRGYLLVMMDVRGTWHCMGTTDDPELRHATDGRMIWHYDRERALQELTRLRGLVECFPLGVVLTGMIELAEGLIVALKPV